MQLIKTHSQTSKRSRYEARNREEKKLKETQTLIRQTIHQNLPRTAGVAGGRDEKGTMAEQNTEKGVISKHHRRKPPAYRQRGRRGETNKGELKENKGAKTRGSHIKQTSTDHRHGGGQDEETSNVRQGR